VTDQEVPKVSLFYAVCNPAAQQILTRISVPIQD
jgi:hypothetical protein